ncbi:MAG: hypothetical protein HY543_02780 [Deltaproteobacteria bacterium]|nr:hypothetical protein [Deltaproteobacteria bacterium]
MPAAIERAIERVRWMRTLSTLRQIDRVECDSGHWWNFWECSGSGDRYLNFKWLHKTAPQLGVLEPGPETELLLKR